MQPYGFIIKFKTNAASGDLIMSIMTIRLKSHFRDQILLLFAYQPHNRVLHCSRFFFARELLDKNLICKEPAPLTLSGMPFW